jgi:hypothetical protein
MPIALKNEATLALLYHLVFALIPMTGAHAGALFLRDTGVNLRASRIVDNVVPALSFIAFGFYLYLAYLFGWRFAIVSAAIFFTVNAVLYGALSQTMRSIKNVEKSANRIVSTIAFSSGVAIYFLLLLVVHVRLLNFEPLEKFNKFIATSLGIPISTY